MMEFFCVVTSCMYLYATRTQQRECDELRQRLCACHRSNASTTTVQDLGDDYGRLVANCSSTFVLPSKHYREGCGLAILQLIGMVWCVVIWTRSQLLFGLVVNVLISCGWGFLTVTYRLGLSYLLWTALVCVWVGFVAQIAETIHFHSPEDSAFFFAWDMLKHIVGATIVVVFILALHYLQKSEQEGQEKQEGSSNDDGVQVV